MIGQAARIKELINLKSTKYNFESECPVIAFTSGKGGTGKSFISLNLAYALSRKKKKVLLIDLDPNLSSINIMLNVQASSTLFHFFSNQSLLGDLIYKYDSHLHFIFGESGNLDHPILNDSNLRSLFEQLKYLTSTYDYVLLDTASGANEYIFSLLSYPQVNVIVTTPEPTSVMDAYVILKLLNKKGVQNKVHTIP